MDVADFFLFFRSWERKGESEVPGGGAGGTWFFNGSSRKGGGSSRRVGGGAEAPGGCLWGIRGIRGRGVGANFFFSGPTFPPRGKRPKTT